MSETKRRVVLWLVASLLLMAAVFTFASANSATTPDAHAGIGEAKAGDVAD
jgi:hypothetical protein